MANPALTSAQALPRFLLPRLSWQTTTTTTTPHHTIRILSTASPSYLTSRPFERPSTSRHPPHMRHNALLKPTSCILQYPTHRRTFHLTARRARDHHFDTLKFVQRLQEEGLTEAQSVAMMKVLSDVIEERWIGTLSPLGISH